MEFDAGVLAWSNDKKSTSGEGTPEVFMLCQPQHPPAGCHGRSSSGQPRSALSYVRRGPAEMLHTGAATWPEHTT